MRNVSDKSCRESQKTHFVCLIIFFPKIVPFMRWCGNIWKNHKGHRWQYKVTDGSSKSQLTVHVQYEAEKMRFAWQLTEALIITIILIVVNSITKYFLAR